ncbi:hypothetical protein TorRG33x02_084890 [Trema orientale]|uniref:Uncharacterized protein n=1 Tax=Trema orientale TaxID=63057 RepID=A0A2P5FCY8_TREOI|nr:hypothetical protein TorRG33x02_084890 [Trema orientale]
MSQPPRYRQKPRRMSGLFVPGEENLGPWKNQISELAAASGLASDDPQTTLVLATNKNKQTGHSSRLLAISRRLGHH